MYAIRNIILFIVLFLNAIVYCQPVDSYYPSPANVDYHNDTLTIFPPDSLPGDPVVLLGYNIYVDSVFYDNVMVTNPYDPVDFIPDFATLFPGNHEFCVNVLYNEWISDRTCDSALVIYGFEIPFVEDWSSENFAENKWITNSGNWTVALEEGNPLPAAVFSGLPAQLNYEIPLQSYAFRGDLIHVGSIMISYDVKLTSNNSTGNEKLFMQRWNWNNNSWETWADYSNESGSFSWLHEIQRLNTNSGSQPVFKIRFVATGMNSADISSWSIDNIHIYRICHEAQELVVEENWDYNELFWMPAYIGCYYPWIHWDDGVNSGNSIGTGAAVEFDVAARWEPSQLAGFEGSPITKIAFFPAEASADYNIRIWSGDSAVNLIVDQPVVNPVIGEWNYITLTSPFLIDVTQEFWAGYHVNTTTGFPAGVDDGPAINGYGNMMYWEGIWRTLLQINPELDYNWNIKCQFGPDPDLPDFTYKIYREVNSYGFQYYATTDDLEYRDTNIYLPDIYCYRVTMEWNKDGDTCESVPTNEACETIWLNACAPDQDQKIKIYPNPAKSWLNVEADKIIRHVRFYSLLGELKMENEINQLVYRLDVSDFQNGVYFLVVEMDDRRILEKAVILK